MLTYNCTAKAISLNNNIVMLVQREYKAESYKIALEGFTQYLYSNKTIKDINNILVIKEA